MKKVFGVIAILAILFALLPVSGVTAAGVKVDVCHVDETGVFHKINISENAFDKHVEHGDASPLEWVPGQLGMKFGEDCSLIAVPQKELVDTILVYPKGVFVPSNIVLTAGQEYELKASGTFTYTGTTWADAEYYLLGGVVVKGDTEGSKPYVLDVSINGYTQNIDWGAYNPAHVYYYNLIGAGSPINFSIYDSNYGDNGGFLTVEIYKINW